MGMRIDSKINGVSSTDANGYITYAQVQQLIAAAGVGGGSTSSGSGMVSARQLMNPKYGESVHPAANASGPIVTNNAITSTKPDTTGMKFIPWNALDEAGVSKFNRQGMNWEAAAAPFVIATGVSSACVNASNAFGGAGYIGSSQTLCAQELHFVTQSKRTIVQYQIYGPYSNYGDFDVTTMIEDGGKMSRVQSVPERISSNSATIPFYKDLTTFGDRVYREHRHLMPGITLIHGVWIESTCDIAPGPNQPLFVLDGDSWTEGLNGGKAAQGVGADPVYGTYMSATIGRWMQVLTGWKFIFNGRGGTGFDATNSGNDTVFLSPARNTYFASKFQAHKPIAYIMPGGGNDGYHNGPVGTPFATYRDNILSRVSDLRTKFNDPALPIVLNGPQSLSDPLTQFPNGPQSVHRAAVIAAVAAGTNMQFFDQIDYTDGNFGDQTGATATSSWGRFTADVLHGCISGQRYVGHRYVDDIAKLVFPADRVNACMAVKL